MATFKVGQRVRVISGDCATARAFIGCVGTIRVAGIFMDSWAVLLDDHQNPANGQMGCYGFFSRNLAPLTDPHADAFIEQVKRWKPEPQIVPLREDELERVGGGL